MNFQWNVLLKYQNELLQALGETGIMLLIGLASALSFGTWLGIALYSWSPKGIFPKPYRYKVLSFIVNTIRSFPFVILLISIAPFTKILVGTSIGPLAASVPLAVSAIAYFSRLVEIALNEVPKGVIVAAQSMGATHWQIIRWVLWIEARPALILATTTLTISYLSYTAAAGIVGGGGIGDLAIRYGYYRFENEIMIATVLGLIILVQVFQSLGNQLSRIYNKK